MAYTGPPDNIDYVEIYPPIGVARVGDSSEHFIASEVPGLEPIPNGGFKDGEGKIKKQAVRFRVYAFGKDSGLLGELDDPKKYRLTWKVHVASKKAAWFQFPGSKGDPETWELRNPGVQSGPKTTEFTNSRTELIIDSKEQIIEGANAKDVFLNGKFGGGNSGIPLHEKVTLGELRTDPQGRLLVLASDGDSFSAAPPAHQDINDRFNSDGWVDKMCDGTVRVTVKYKSDSQLERDITVKNRATIIVAPPRFSSGTHAPTTLYDLIEEMYERPKRKQAGYKLGEVNYYRDIQPLFKRIYMLSWTSRDASDGHGPGRTDVFDKASFSNPEASNDERAALLFKRIRDPVIKGDPENQKTRNKQTGARYMPELSGDQGPARGDSKASLTQLQHDRLMKWSDPSPGIHFTNKRPEVYKSFDEIPLNERPSALTRAALEWSIGGAFYPGIETFWIVQDEDNYEPENGQPGNRFRFADKVTPGDLTKGLCLPWQSDFYMCTSDWWPSVRPFDVVTEAYFQQFRGTPPAQLASKLTNRWDWHRGINGNSEMVRKWTKLGFVAQQPYGNDPNLPEISIERQRSTDLPL
ncbi:unnamed protein product [Rhizoctonia solani]|uniref:L-lysine 6-oxidase n=1 Tax=Rhizoctonia solani TaxID=456999 RepID=A0A8H3HY80_9AGAM|nr:unnamed protein product [Rhizoctonia solani]